MLISFATRFATLSSIFRSRAALELENLALALSRPNQLLFLLGQGKDFFLRVDQ